jgi:hypothetical protein
MTLWTSYLWATSSDRHGVGLGRGASQTLGSLSLRSRSFLHRETALCKTHRLRLGLSGMQAAVPCLEQLWGDLDTLNLSQKLLATIPVQSWR